MIHSVHVVTFEPKTVTIPSSTKELTAPKTYAPENLYHFVSNKFRQDSHFPGCGVQLSCVSTCRVRSLQVEKTVCANRVGEQATTSTTNTR